MGLRESVTRASVHLLTRTLFRLRVVGGPTRLAEALAEENPACLLIDLEAGDEAIALIRRGVLEELP